MTSLQRHHVVLMLFQRKFEVVCHLGLLKIAKLGLLNYAQR